MCHLFSLKGSFLHRDKYVNIKPLHPCSRFTDCGSFNSAAILWTCPPKHSVRVIPPPQNSSAKPSSGVYPTDCQGVRPVQTRASYYYIIIQLSPKDFCKAHNKTIDADSSLSKLHQCVTGRCPDTQVTGTLYKLKQ